jgi:hypothetical protein
MSQGRKTPSIKVPTLWLPSLLICSSKPGWVLEA